MVKSLAAVMLPIVVSIVVDFESRWLSKSRGAFLGLPYTYDSLGAAFLALREMQCATVLLGYYTCVMHPLTCSRNIYKVVSSYG